MGTKSNKSRELFYAEFELPPVAYWLFELVLKVAVEVKERILPSETRLRERIEAESPRIKRINELKSVAMKEKKFTLLRD